MPSINRLLVLAVLSVSFSVRALPVPEDASTELELYSDDLHDLDAFALGESDEFVDDELDLGNYEEVEFIEPEAGLERRAGLKKTTAKPPAKAPVKAPVKAPAKTPVKAPTKAAPAKAPVKAPAAPAKAPSKAPAKTPAKACTPNKFKGKGKRDMFADLDRLFKRDGKEFVGWHGTNSDTAALWKEKGQLVKPTKASGFFDFLGLGPTKDAGRSGADAENGPGLYVTDDIDIAVAFANGNAKVNPGTTPAVCAIFARSSDNWRTALRKVFLPEKLVTDSSDPKLKANKEKARLEYIKKVVPGVSAANVVRFSLLNRSARTGQMVLSDSITNLFSAECTDASPNANIPGASTFPTFSYNAAGRRSEWDIAAEQECAA